MNILGMAAPGVLLLGIVIFVHELGHFLAAKWRGVRVLRFSLGFGPALFAFTRGETQYRLAWIPLGGYVQMAGDSPGEDHAMPGGIDQFLSHPWYGRILIALAGPAANLVTAYLVFVATAMVGITRPDYPSELGPVAETTAAHRLGLRQGDRVVRVGDRVVATWGEYNLALRDRGRRQPVALGILRGDSAFALEVPAAQLADFAEGLRARPLPPVIGNVVTGMPAYKAGLKPGDRVLAVNGREIRTWDELPQAIGGLADRSVLLRVRRGNEDFDLSVTPMKPTRDARARGLIGVEPPRGLTYTERVGPLRALAFGVDGVVSFVGQVYGGMWLAVSHPLYYREYLGGPLLIAQGASEQARQGASSFLMFLALINLAIMAFNLLPIPVLDGGHIVLALLEALRRRAISYRGYVRFQQAGLVVIGTLFILILANDPLRIIQRQRALDRIDRDKTAAPARP